MPIASQGMSRNLRRSVRRSARAGLGCLLAMALAGPFLASAEDFPLREKYASVGVQPVETETLAASLDEVAVVDARSIYEYETLHIQGARSIPLASSGFAEAVRTLAETSGQPLVFYCNGVTCSVSYKAAFKAKEAGVADARVYDAGVFAWAQANPEQTVLLGEPLEQVDQLISGEQFERHLLDEDAFYARIMASKKPIIVDIRSKGQRAGVSLFQMQDRHIPLTTDNRELSGLVERARAEERPMFFVDATGKQVRWLQYYLEEQGLADYWFLKGGALTIFEGMGTR